jgi:hypothetical protein
MHAKKKFQQHLKTLQSACFMNRIKYTFDIKYKVNQIINLGKGKEFQLIRED